MYLLFKNVLFTVLVPGTVAIYLPLLLARGLLPGAGLWRMTSSLCFLVGGAVYAWCVWDFAVYGRGTPAPIDAPRQLVVRGLYRCTRNPMYVGVLLVILGWAFRYRAPGLMFYALCVWGGFQCFVVYYEEPHLQRVFGAAYDAYRARVGRWLFKL